MPRLPVDSERPPIFIGAGIIRTKEQILYYSREPLLAAQVIGSFSESEWGGADPSGQKAVFYWDEKRQAAYNAIGLRNCGRVAASEYMPDCIKAVKDAGQLAIISITSLLHEDPVEVLPRLAEWAVDSGADGVEVNGSCPNQKLHGLLCENADKTNETIDVIRNLIGHERHIQLKVSALDKEAIKRYRTDYRLAIDAIVAINNCRRISPINEKTGLPYIEVNDGYAGESGPIIRDLARSNLEMWLEDYSQDGTLADTYDVWSIGGVASGTEVYCRHREMGAFLVGGAQEFHRSNNPHLVIEQWAEQYKNATDNLII